MRKLFLFIMLSLMLATLVNAAPPTFYDQSTGLSVVSDIGDSIKKGSYTDVHAHIFDGGNGTPVYSNANCFIHVYNATGNHIINQYEGTSSGFDYGFELEANNFTQVGRYEYIIQCNNSIKGGYISAGFYVTESGLDPPEANLLIFFMLISVFVFLTMIVSLYKIFDDFAKINASFKTVFIGFGAYTINLAYYYFLVNFMPWDLMLDISFICMSAFGITHLFIPLVALIFSWIKNRSVS